MSNETRRVTIDLRRPLLSPYFGLRPTIVVEGRAQPTQWGVGTWLLPADRDAIVSVFLFRWGVTTGRAATILGPEDAPLITYRAPWLPLLPGRFR